MRPRQQGFTLIEMVVAITVSAVVVGFMAMFLVMPVDQYVAQERRTELNDSANSALRMLKDDIRKALPDSVRVVNVGGSLALEMLHAPHVARYRPNGSSGVAAQDLTIGTPDSQFSTLGLFATAGAYNGYLVVDHPAAGDAYSGSGVISPLASIAIGPLVNGEQAVDLGSTSVTFPADSPTRSVYFVSGPVSYVCDPAAGTLKRFDSYAIAANQAGHATEAALLAAGAARALVARDVTACTFQYTTTALGGPLARLRMTFARNGETLQVFEQVQVENRP